VRRAIAARAVGRATMRRHHVRDAAINGGASANADAWVGDCI
jgi:hypothetical protein